MKLELEPKELKKVQDWMEEHDKTCPFADRLKQGAIGGRVTYRITYTSIGAVTSLVCACGKTFDFTDYGEW